jgi:hypothetical protein
MSDKYANHTLGILAKVYADIKERHTNDKRGVLVALVGQAMQSSDLYSFIDFYSQGWLGVEGRFARVLARAVQSIE